MTTRKVPVQILNMIKEDKERIDNINKMIRQSEKYIKDCLKKISGYEENIIQLEKFINEDCNC